MRLKIVTAEKTIVNEEIRSMITTGEVGQFEILEHHSPLIALTVPSPTVYKDLDGKRKVLFASRGVLRVLNNEILFITDAAEPKEQIDLERATAARDRALQALKDPRSDVGQWREALARAEGRIWAKTLE